MATKVGTNAMGLDENLFTRGTGDDKPRGESMVQKHLEKLQQEKETLAIQKMGALLPQLGPLVRVVALKEAVFDVETALGLLRSFQTQNDEQLKALHKKRKKLKDAEAEAVKEAEEEEAAARAREASSASSSGSSGSEDSSSGSESDSEPDRKRRRKDSGKKKRSSKDRKGRSKDRSNRSKSKRSSRKDKKRVKSPKGPASAADNFGKYGIIRETDTYAKRSEFTLWAMEVRKQDVELLGRLDEKELFRDYMEDYNTGTLPHRKYYNLETYEREKQAKAAAKAAKEGRKVAGKPSSALDDEKALLRAREEERQKLAAERMQQAYAELHATGKAQDMKEQELLRLEMQNAYKTGDKKKAQRLFDLLNPEEKKK